MSTSIAVHENESAVLDRLERVLVFLAEAKDLQAVKSVVAMAAAAKVYAKQVEAGTETINRATEIRLRAERRLGEILLESPKAVAGRPKKIGTQTEPISKSPTLASSGISKNLSSRAQVLAKASAKQFESLLKSPQKELSATQVVKSLRQEQKQAPAEPPVHTVLEVSVSPSSRAISSLDPLIAENLKYGCIYADPPWKYGNQGTRASTNNHYATMSPEEIASLPVGQLAAEKCHLWLWTTNGFLFECQKIFKAWGFEFKSSYIWVKPQIGIGNYLRNSHEFLLLAVRGGLTAAARDVKSWGEFPRTEHSTKPEPIRTGIVERISPGPRLELFGRRLIPGWTVFGNQIKQSSSEVSA